MIDQVLADIDELVSLCPCGAEPRTGSAYCSADCEPTHHGIHTTADHDGTAMRWRPDLLITHDDTGLELICADIPQGPFTGTMYRRTSTDAIHLRLDDRHRWVGCDVPEGDSPAPILRAWARLAQELTDLRQAEPDGLVTAGPFAGWRELVPIRDDGRPNEGGPFRAPRDMNRLHARAELPDFDQVTATLRSLGPALTALAEQFRQVQIQLNIDPVEVEHPLARMNARRRNQTHGPQHIHWARRQPHP